MTAATPPDAQTLVLGAGLAGLSASLHLGGAPILEASDVPGGLAASRRRDGFTFDYTGHLLHFKVPYVRDLVESVLGESLLRHRRSSFVQLGERLVRYPFQANLHELDEDVRRECLDGLLAAQREPPRRSSDFRQWILDRFGRGIARHFMWPYNEKLWQFPLEEMSCAWIDGLIPQPRADEVLAAADGRGREYGYNVEFSYPREGGIGRLAEALADRAGPIEYGARAVAVDPIRRRLTLADGRARGYRTLISTMPLPELVRRLDPCPPEIAALGRELVWNSVLNVNLGIEGPETCDRHWTYFPDPSYVFYRVGHPSAFSASMAPAGKRSLYVEVSYRGPNPHDTEQLLARIAADLVRAGLLDDPARIVTSVVNDLRFAYVIYDRRHGAATRALHAWLEEAGIHSIGRFGRWRYYSMEQTILDGKVCAETLREASCAPPPA